jgi:hypothetical protein
LIFVKYFIENYQTGSIHCQNAGGSLQMSTTHAEFKEFWRQHERLSPNGHFGTVDNRSLRDRVVLLLLEPHV